MARILAIDPGTTHTAYCLWDGVMILEKGKIPNAEVFDVLRKHRHSDVRLAVEVMQSFGMAVGASVFETCIWIGRFVEFWGGPAWRVYRLDEKLHHCKNPRAKDGNIRQALIDRFGSPGTKSSPGVTYGVSSDVWSAFAIATLVWDHLTEGRERPAYGPFVL